jgi:maltose alpha-D-glucosyltransferase/alpha-amylase
VLGENRAVLVYLRLYGDDAILVTANLSSKPQSVELDISAFAGTQPSDLLTGELLKPMSSEPYRLELEPYKYRWLQL